MTLRVGLVGCGRIAQRHAEILGTRLVPGLRLAGVCDLKEERASALGSKYSVPSYASMHRMVEQISPDLIVVLTESGNHATHVVELAKHGRHIMVEKPMALSSVDATRMVEACDAAGVKLFVVKQNRFNLPVVKLKEAVDDGRFGKIFLGTVRVRWRRPREYYEQDSWRGTINLDGGVLSNQASHHLDLLEWMLGKPESVLAMADTFAAKIEAEDTATALIRFASGALGVVEATTATSPKDLEGSLSVLGTTGSAVIGGFSVNKLETWEFEHSIPEDTTMISEFSENPPDVYGFGHRAYYSHVVEALTQGVPLLVDGLAGRRSVELLESIYQSIRTGAEVKLDRSKSTRLGPN